jgi:hypothetical protein
MFRNVKMNHVLQERIMYEIIDSIACQLRAGFGCDR